MRSPNTKSTALSLRNDGASISEIAEELSIPKSTVSYWCRNLQLSPSKLRALQEKSKHAGQTKLREVNEQKRRDRITKDDQCMEVGKTLVSKLSRKELMMVGLGLYWGEGYKNGNTEFGITNNDPHAIAFILHWLFYCLHVKKEELTLRISMNVQHKSRQLEIERYWQKLTHIPREQFTKTSLIKSHQKKFSPSRPYYGTLRIKVKRGSILRLKLLGAIHALDTSYSLMK